MSAAPSLVDPSTGEAVCDLETTPPSEALALTNAARVAQQEWGLLPVAQRGRQLRAVAENVRADRELVDLICGDVGKPRGEAEAEVERAASIFEYYAGLATLPSGELYEDAAGRQIRVIRRPRGVVLLITPWNFPIAIPVWKLAPALLAGNAAVIKPSTPATRIASRLVDAVVSAGIPGDCCLLAKGSAEIAEALLDAGPDIVSFTGSTAVGRAIHRSVGGRMIPVQLEMGGKNAVYVSAQADLGDAAQIVATGAMGYAGQKCTASSRVYVADQTAAEFRSALVDEVAELATGDPRSPGTVVGPMISIQARDAAVGAVAAGTDRGIEVLHGGESIDSPGFFMTPTVLYGGDADDPLLTEELFAPVVAVQPVADIDQALERVNALESGIVAGIVSPLHSEIEYFAQRANVGVIRVNAPTTGLEPHVPFGGVGSSSFGPREQGLAGLEAFRESRTIYG